MRRPLLALLATLLFAAPAAAAPVLVYDNGHVQRADDPALPPADATNAGLDAPQACVPGGAPAASAHASVVSVSGALRRAYDRGAIDQATVSGYRDAYSAAKHAWHRLAGNR